MATLKKYRIINSKGTEIMEILANSISYTPAGFTLVREVFGQRDEIIATVPHDCRVFEVEIAEEKK
jgi:hypothetical protein